MKILHITKSDDSPLLLRLQVQDAQLLDPPDQVESWMLGRAEAGPGGPVLRERDLAPAVRRSGADLCHFYTRSLPGGAALRNLSVPWIASDSGVRWRLFRRHHVEPSRLFFAHPALGGEPSLPESVPESYFSQPGSEHPGPVVGGIVTIDTNQQYQSVRARVARFRDDVIWRPFSTIPTPDEIGTVSVWVDFGVHEMREPSGIPEALVAGRAVIAPRTDLNRSRLLEGEAGFLVPKSDPNEMAHVILTALFKPEVSASRVAATLDNRDRFRPEKRRTALQELYRAVVANGVK